MQSPNGAQFLNTTSFSLLFAATPVPAVFLTDIVLFKGYMYHCILINLPLTFNSI